MVAEDELARRAAVAELTGAGWLPASDDCAPMTIITLSNHSDAERAVLAALRGDGLLVVVSGDGAAPSELDGLIDDLVEDLRRIGPVRVFSAATMRTLDAETWRLLHVLAQGATVSAAAQALHVSVRTVNRRLSEAREVFRAQSRAQLLRSVLAPERIPPAQIMRR